VHVAALGVMGLWLHRSWAYARVGCGGRKVNRHVTVCRRPRFRFI
jgi:hypothetical protein